MSGDHLPFADYQQLAAAYRGRCHERRRCEAEHQTELAELSANPVRANRHTPTLSIAPVSSWSTRQILMRASPRRARLPTETGLLSQSISSKFSG
jgi:hypothetical protein